MEQRIVSSCRPISRRSLFPLARVRPLVYDTDGNPPVALEEPEVMRMMGEVSGLTIADLGTGTGRHASRLGTRGREGRGT